MNTQSLDLTGIWRFQPDPANDGEALRYYASDYDCRFWREARVPCTFDECMPALDCYEGAGWFRRTFVAPPDWSGRRVAIRFEGVSYHAKVWINGQKAGVHEHGFLPFDFEIGPLLRWGATNTVTVRVDNTRLPCEAPGPLRGWRPFGGILREVGIFAGDFLRLESLAIQAEPDGDIRIRTVLINHRPTEVQATLTIDITDPYGQPVMSFSAQTIRLQRGETHESVVKDRIAGIAAWSPEQPALYRATARLAADGVTDSEQAVRFGFRRIEVQDNRLLLNGLPIRLVGFNRHEDSSTRNMTFDADVMRADLQAIKTTGANFLRLCHYPHHPAELDLCDELGLLTMAEIPMYWSSTDSEPPAVYAKKVEAGARQLRAMIRRDINHPSIVFWSVSNETDESRPEVVEGNRQLVRLAKELDATRLAVHVSSHWVLHPHFEEDDVACVNGYPSLNQVTSAGGPPAAAATWRRDLEKLHSVYPHKPIFVTEFGYISLEGLHGNAFSEEEQAEVLALEFSNMDAPYVCGAAIWCWADHAWPPSLFNFGLAISPYGVVTRERRPLRALETVRHMFGGVSKQADSAAASKGAFMTLVRPLLLDLPTFEMPAGFRIRPMRQNEEGLWLDILRDADPGNPDIGADFLLEWERDRAAAAWRCFIAETDRGIAVGTVGAWYDRDFRGKDFGCIRWLAVRPIFRRQGIAKACLSFALVRLSQWHEGAYVRIPADQPAAKALCRAFGFIPEAELP